MHFSQYIFNKVIIYITFNKWRLAVAAKTIHLDFDKQEFQLYK